jgi:hypothetical protein
MVISRLIISTYTPVYYWMIDVHACDSMIEYYIFFINFLRGLEPGDDLALAYVQPCSVSWNAQQGRL